jgi:hypothetical protein
MKRTTLVIVASLVLFLTATRAKAALLTVNGGFETGFAGWTVLDQAGGSGSWFIQTGTASPLNGFAVPSPPEGSFAGFCCSGRSHVGVPQF